MNKLCSQNIGKNRLTPISNNDVAINDHVWALMDGMLLVAMKTEKSEYYLCGGWEYTVDASKLEIREIIQRPKFHDAFDLYYGV